MLHVEFSAHWKKLLWHARGIRRYMSEQGNETDFYWLPCYVSESERGITHIILWHSRNAGTFLLLDYKSLFKSNYFIVFEAWFLKVGLLFMVIWSFGYCFGLVIDYINKFIYAFHPGGSDGKESACSAGSSGLIPGLGRSPGEGNVYPLQYSCLENPMDRGAWQATVHGVAQSRTWLSYWHFHFFFLSCTPLCTQLSLSHLRVNSLLSWKEL